MTGARNGARRGARRHARLLPLLLLCFGLSGCLSVDQPTPSPGLPSSAPSVAPSQALRDPDTLVVAVADDPVGLLPSDTANQASDLLVGMLYDPLYRLDGSLQPQPVLAAALPVVTGAGQTWDIALAGPDLRFQDGWALSASDVAYSLLLAKSSACSLTRELCDTTAAHLADVQATARDHLTITLSDAFSPFLAEVLAQLPVFEEVAVRAGTAALVESASGIPTTAPDALVKRVDDAVTADACLAEQSPFGCHMADHQVELEAMLSSAGLPLPSHAAFTDVMGAFDAEAYASALLDRIDAIGQVLTSSGIDQQAAALPLLDPVARSMGSGPFRMLAMPSGGPVELAANPYHVGGIPAIPKVSIRVVPDAATASTLLLGGDVDWLPQIEPDQVASLAGASGLTIAKRPLSAQRTIIFNVRPDHIYADAATRQAFAMCLDRASLVAGGSAEVAIPAWVPTAFGSWAMTPGEPGKRDVEAARTLLAGAGWAPGADGIMVRGSQRLSSQVAVRASRADLLVFAHSAAAQLKECGIELEVQDLDVTGDLVLSQLQWPNDFDTLLVSRPLGADPDHDMAAFESRHATTADDQADANPGGYVSADADRLIAAARDAPAQADRVALYAQLQALLERDQPSWPIWYETAWAGISTRVQGTAGAIDPSRPRYDWDLAAWTLTPPASPSTHP